MLFEDVQGLSKDELYDNMGIISQEAIEKAKLELIAELEKLEEYTGDSEHIVVVADSCFTNGKLLLLLKNILGLENYEKFVKVVDIDYESEADDSYLEDQLAVNHSLFILGGSLSDTYSMHDSHYRSSLAKMIRETTDEYSQRYLNKRIIGICFGQQYLANIIGIANKNSAGIIATLK